MSKMRAVAVLGIAAGLFAMGLSQTERASRETPSWLGPFAPIAAQVQWVRAERAIQHGFPGRAIDFMESAIDLNPKSGPGWMALANHLGLYLASAEAGWTMEVRVAWLKSALDVTHRGQKWARHPEELSFHRGMLLLSHARLAEPLEWGDSPNALWQDAATAFREAAELGHVGGEAAQAFALEQL